jgi:hypothetical protein
MRKINYRVLHHTASQNILFEGQLEANPSWNCGNDDINDESIAVACIGNFEVNLMSGTQKNRLIQTVFVVTLNSLTRSLTVGRKSPGQYC